MVPATDLLELGLRLMATCEDGPTTRVYRATQFRDGLLIALLISCPMRLSNLAGLVIGQHVVFDGRGYGVKLAVSETKTGRPYCAAGPTELTTRVDLWLAIYRKTMQLIAPDRGQGSLGGTSGSTGTAGP